MIGAGDYNVLYLRATRSTSMHITMHAVLNLLSRLTSTTKVRKNFIPDFDPDR